MSGAPNSDDDRVLRSLRLVDLGPTDIDLDFGSELTVITGDNSLGKSFVLDTAWWGGTRSWPGEVAEPRSVEHSRIHVKLEGTAGVVETSARFRSKDRSWVSERVGTFPKPRSIFVYVRSDGSVSLWDPSRDYAKWVGESTGDDDDAMPLRLRIPGVRGLHLTPRQIMREGLVDEDGNVVVPSLIDEWTRWQLAAGDEEASDEERAPWQMLARVLATLSPSGEPLKPGRRLRIRSSLDERRMPSLEMSWGDHVPVIHASAGIQRVISLAYLLVWSWFSHMDHTEAQQRAKSIVLLVDEPETHLHPRWQRTILPSILALGANDAGPFTLPLQVVVATHSPHALASVEHEAAARPAGPDEPPRHVLYNLALVDGRVELARQPWIPRGSVSAWLTSATFGLSSTDPVDVETIKRDARKLINARSSEVEDSTVMQMDAQLHDLLSTEDPFWGVWSSWQRGRSTA